MPNDQDPVEQIKQLMELLECVVDQEPCWFDHHGGCQEHGYLNLKPGEICPQQEVKDRIKAWQERNGS